MIVILVGPPGAGKTTIRTHLEDRGWIGYEASSYIQRAMGEYKATNLGELVEKAGKGIAARMIWKEIEQHPPQASFVISGFRAPFEVASLQSKAPITVIGLYADIHTCYERIKKRKRSGDAPDFERFQQRVRDDYALGIAAIFQKQVDIFIDSRRDVADLVERISRIEALERPEWTITFDDVRNKLRSDSGRNLASYAERIAIADRPRV